MKSVVTSFMRVIRLEQGHHYKSWTARGFRIIEDHVAILAEFLTHAQLPGEIVTRENAEMWFSENQNLKLIFLKMLESVFFHLYNYRGNIHKSEYRLNFSLLPTCENENFVAKYSAFLDISQILFINSQLPNELQNKWRFLYSSRVHDESFRSLLAHVINQGSTVIIVEDTNGYIFGGFATDSWTLR